MTVTEMLSAKRLTIAEVAADPRVLVSYSTVYRWVTKGVKGRKLTTITIGGRQYVPECALEEFLSFGLTELAVAE